MFNLFPDMDLGEYRGIFIARITARAEPLSGDTRYRYSWEEQYIDPVTGSLQRATPFRSGDETFDTAYELNNHKIEVGTYVWMRMRGMHLGSPVYEFPAPDGSSLDLSGSGSGVGGSGAILMRLPTRVCPTKTGGQVTSITVETRAFRFPAGTVVGLPQCDVSQTECCPESGSSGGSGAESGMVFEFAPTILVGGQRVMRWLSFTVTQATGECLCLPSDGILLWDQTANAWIYHADLTACNKVVDLRLYRDDDGWHLVGSMASAYLLDQSETPLYQQWECLEGGLCEGVFKVTITE